MKIKDLKVQILNKLKLDQFMIFICKENYFLANQYINTYCKNLGLQKEYVKTVQETHNTALSLVLDQTQSLNIVVVDEFEEDLSSYSEYTDCVVICKKVSKSIQNKVEKFCIEFPTLEDWQIKDYIKVMCKGLDQYDIDWLYDNTNGNIYKIETEVNKIKLFPSSVQQSVLAELKFEKESDLYSITLFNLSEAILKKDIITIVNYLSHKSICDFDAFALIGLLLSTFKKVLFVNFNSGLTAEQLGLSLKQYNAIKFYYKTFSKDYVENSITFLTALDEKIKTGKLDIPKDNLLDYIICNVVSFNK